MNVRLIALITGVVVVGTVVVLIIVGAKTAWEAPATIVALVVLVAGGNWLGGRTPRHHDVEPVPLTPLPTRASVASAAGDPVAAPQSMECPMSSWVRPGSATEEAGGPPSGSEHESEAGSPATPPTPVDPATPPTPVDPVAAQGGS